MTEAKKLALTVHHRGMIFPAGKTAEEIGPLAAEIGDHAWEGGKAPAASAIPGSGTSTGGLMLGTRLVPPPSGLPGNAPGEDPALEQLRGPLGTQESTQDPGTGTGGADTGSGVDDGDTAGSSDPAQAGAGDGSNTPPAGPVKRTPAKKATGTGA